MNKIFPITRCIDYRVNQTFLVSALNSEEAEEKVEEFLEAGDYEQSAALEAGVVQIDDEMEQIENSHEIGLSTATKDDLEEMIAGGMNKISIECNAAKMFELLTRISTTPAMFHANVTGLGLEVKALVDNIQAEMAAPRSTLAKMGEGFNITDVATTSTESAPKPR